jgi:hypothetical protein
MLGCRWAKSPKNFFWDDHLSQAKVQPLPQSAAIQLNHRALTLIKDFFRYSTLQVSLAISSFFYLTGIPSITVWSHFLCYSEGKEEQLVIDTHTLALPIKDASVKTWRSKSPNVHPVIKLNPMKLGALWFQWSQLWWVPGSLWAAKDISFVLIWLEAGGVRPTVILWASAQGVSERTRTSGGSAALGMAGWEEGMMRKKEDS